MIKPTLKGSPVKASRSECNPIFHFSYLHILTWFVVSGPSIDSGIDYTDSLLGGGFGPGFKVGGGWDFVGDNYDGGNTPVPDSDPLDK